MKLADCFKKRRKLFAVEANELGEGTKLTAKDAMIKPAFIYPDEDASAILNKLKKEDINVCIVVTKEKKLVGEISDDDIIRLFLAEVKYEPITKLLNWGYKRGLAYKQPAELAKKCKTTVKPGTPIREVIEVMAKEEYTYIPVLDDKKRVIGVVTPSSLIDILKNC